MIKAKNLEELQRVALKLSNYMVDAVSRKESPDRIYEYMIALADWYSWTLGSGHAEVKRMYQSSRTMIPMFGWFGAEEAWRNYRRTFGWMDRRRMPREAPTDFKAEWSDMERARAKAIVRAIFIEEGVDVDAE